MKDQPFRRCKMGALLCQRRSTTISETLSKGLAVSMLSLASPLTDNEDSSNCKIQLKNERSTPLPETFDDNHQTSETG